MAEFKNLYGGIYGVLAGLPVFSSLLRASSWRYALWPPLASLQWLNAGVVIVALVPAVALWFVRDGPVFRAPRRMRSAAGALAVMMLLLVGYAAIWNVTVIRLESERCPGSHVGEPVEDWVSVGFWRSGSLAPHFAGRSDLDALCSYGHSEEALRDIWGTASLFFSRISLVLTLCGLLCAATTLAALFPLFRYLEKTAEGEQGELWRADKTI